MRFLLCLLLTGVPLAAQVVDGRAHLKPGETTNLSGDWNFSFGDQSRMMQIPAGWISRGVVHDGPAVYSARFSADFKEDLLIAMPRALGAYELFWNGKLIGVAGSIDQNGNLLEGDSRLLAFHVLAEDVQPENEVRIKVRGMGAMGGLLGSAFAGPAKTAQTRLELRTLWGAVLVGFFFFAAVLHLIYFFFDRREAHYAFFAAVSVLMGVGALMRASWTHLIHPSPLFNLACVMVPLHLLPPVLVGFLGHFFKVSGSRVPRAILILNLAALVPFAASLAGLMRPDSYARFLLPGALILPVIGFGYGGYIVIAAMRARKFGAGMMAAGYAVFATVNLLEVAASRGLMPGLSLGVEGYLALMLTMALALSIQFSETHKRLEKTYHELTESEEKYRSLIEGSHQLIVSMTPAFIITSINGAVRNWLGHVPERMVGRHFVDLVFSRAQDPAKLMVLEQLERALVLREPSRFVANMRTSLDEPREMELETELAQNAEGDMLIVKASGRTTSEISKLCLEETQRYAIGNYIVLAEMISLRLTEKVEDVMPRDDVFSFRMALRELIINAMEHGNLEISFAEKTAAQEDDSYYALVRSKQQNPVLTNRKVHIEYSYRPGRFEATIRDEGRGFDHKKAMSANADELAQAGLGHGRGILIAKSEFDELKYNEAGNEVTVVKALPL